MTITSYAQNYEDIMLERALRSVEQGFYIDVGANDPDHFSVTKLFYEKGWRGINIEPIPQWFEQLCQKRPRDINLQVAAGAEQGELIIYELPDTGLSTLDQGIAEAHRQERGFSINERQVSVERLNDICNRLHVAPIHFLKIDVEGAEEMVLQGLDLNQIRPWIILVESTLPLTQVEDYEDWEGLILEKQYNFVYFDGLNRFYIADEHPELRKSFATPPNIFDDFQTFAWVSQKNRADDAEAHSATLQVEVDALSQQLQTELGVLNEQLKQTENELELAKQQLSSIRDELKDSRQKFNDNKRQAKNCERELTESREKAHYWWTEACDRQNLLNHANQQLVDLRKSSSWRLTRPIRAVKLLIFHPQRKTLARERLVNPAKRKLRPMLLKAIAKSGQYPKARAALGRALKLTPALRARLVRIAYPSAPTIIAAEAQFLATEKMNARARQIYSDLKGALNQESRDSLS